MHGMDGVMTEAAMRRWMWLAERHQHTSRRSITELRVRTHLATHSSETTGSIITDSGSKKSFTAESTDLSWDSSCIYMDRRFVVPLSLESMLCWPGCH